MFIPLPSQLCLPFVCLIVSRITQKTTQTIFTKFSAKVALGSRKIRLDFGGNRSGRVGLRVVNIVLRTIESYPTTSPTERAGTCWLWFVDNIHSAEIAEDSQKVGRVELVVQLVPRGHRVTTCRHSRRLWILSLCRRQHTVRRRVRYRYTIDRLCERLLLYVSCWLNSQPLSNVNDLLTVGMSR